MADAAWVVEAERIVVEDGVFVAENGRVHLGDAEVAFARARWTAEGFVFTEAAGSVCDCHGPDLWSIAANEASVDVDETLRVRGAWLRIADRRVLPLPAGALPLDRRSGWLLPKFELGYDGLRVQTPYFQTLGDAADVTMAPEVRTGRAARLLGEHRYARPGGGGTTRGMVAWDWGRGAWRGSAEWQHAVPVGYGGVASEGMLVSDEAVYADYGDRYLDRRRPWGEARTLARLGAFEVGSRALQLDTATDPEWAFVRAQRPAVEGGGFVASSAVTAAWVGEEPRAVGQVEAEVARPIGVGALRVLPRVAGVGRVALGEAPTATATAETLLALPAWRRTEGAFERLEPRMGVRWDVDGAAAVAQLAWRRTGARQTTEFGADAAWNGAAWSLGADAWLDRGALRGFAVVSARGDRSNAGFDRAIGALSVAEGPVRPFLRAAFVADPEGADALTRVEPGATWRLPGVFSAWTASAAVAFDPRAGALRERGGTLAFAHPNGCLVVDGSFRWDDDRAWPDVGVRVGVRPAR